MKVNYEWKIVTNITFSLNFTKNYNFLENFKHISKILIEVHNIFIFFRLAFHRKNVCSVLHVYISLCILRQSRSIVLLDGLRLLFRSFTLCLEKIGHEIGSYVLK